MSVILATSRFAVYLAVGFAWNPKPNRSIVPASSEPSPARVIEVQPLSVAVGPSPPSRSDASRGGLLDTWA